MRTSGVIFAAMVGLSTALTAGTAQMTVERLQPIAGLPAHVCGQFRQPIGFAQTSTGQYLVLDRRAHIVYSVDKERSTLSTLVQVGLDKGELLQPGVLSLAPDDTFAVADAPFRQERVQVFFDSGTRRDAFLRPGVVAPRITMGPLILSGAGSLHYTGRRVLLSAPETGSLVSELDLQGNVTGRIGTLRTTGHESDPQVHLALNQGLPFATSDGGVVFVFTTGVPLFRRYDAAGRLVLERHIEGMELDAYAQGLPTSWPNRQIGDGTYPLVPPVVQAAAVSPEGDLWISLSPSVTYVYDRRGDKTRTITFNATGLLTPTSLSFSAFSGSTRVLAMPGCYEFSAIQQ